MMEDHESSALATAVTEQPAVDTARPFRSVKEAVAVFGERLLAGDVYSQNGSDSGVKLDAASPEQIRSPPPPPKPIHSSSSSPPSHTCSASQFDQEGGDEILALGSLRKLEEEMEEAKGELMLLKERECKTEIAVADLKKKLQEIMSKLAEMEAREAAGSGGDIEGRSTTRVGSDRWADEIRSREMEARFEYLPTLAQALGLGDIEEDDVFGGRGKRKAPKKKPIIPLIGDMFSRKKGSFDLNSSLRNSHSYHGVLG